MPEFNNSIVVGVLIQPVICHDMTTRFVGIDPALAPIGGLAFPSGFQEYPDNVEETVAKETFQEVGLKIDPKTLRIVGSLVGGTAERSRLLIFCEAPAIREEDYFSPDGKWLLPIQKEEVNGVVLLVPHISQLCFPHHQTMLDLAYTI